MIHDGKINIATGLNVRSTVWKNKTLNWSDFVKTISEPSVMTVGYKAFIAANKEEQTSLKGAAGGYVGGYLRSGKRSPKNVMHRQLLTLDIDFAHFEFWEDFTLQYTNAAILHGTAKHSKAMPRYRLLMPLDRECTPDEYVAVGRQVAGELGVDLFDNTTFETNRLMFYPVVPKDVDYYCEVQDGAWLNVDEILASYIDWTDTSLWPTSGQMLRELGDRAKKQADPREKSGIVGAFCRTHGIAEVIEKYLIDEYSPTDRDDRYTYTQGSTAGGLIVYEDTFAFSHHGTDPCSGKTSNAFDLVRLHKFGHLDSENQTTGVKAKSFAAMEALALKDKEVKKLIAAESLEAIKYDFVDSLDDYDLDEPEAVEGASDAVEWMSELDTDNRGAYLSSAQNLNLIFTNDARLKDCFKQNQFDNKRYAFKTLPWRRVTKPEPLRNVDYSGIRNYIETIYGITGVQKIDDALALEFEKRSFHPIKDYLNGLEWDGQERVDYLLIDYFGAPDNAYTREAIRKTLVAAVSRVYNPGQKFDLVLTLIGAQGTNKSTFINKLGGEWYSDSFMTVSGNQAFEQLQGAWIMEIAEMAGFRKSDVEGVKHYLTKQIDTYRPAYGKVVESYPRQNIFIATSNKHQLFTDPSGNRRFMPIDVKPEEVLKSVWHDLDAEIPQIWAEATYLYSKGESLFLSARASIIADKEQREHCDVDDRTGIVEQYLNTLLPANWERLDLDQRRMFLNDPEAEQEGIGKRDRVCIAEIWCECLGKNKEDMSRYLTGSINDIMKSLESWEYKATTANFGVYGKQKFYSRKK
jgi:predicted P-loop ATPase